MRQRPTFPEGRLEDGTPICPRIRLAVAEAPAPLPGLEQHRTVTWRVGGRDTEHVMLFLSVSHLTAGSSGGADAAALANSCWHTRSSMPLLPQPSEFQQHVQRDGLASLLHAAEAARPGCRLHLLTYRSQSTAMDDQAVRQWAADLAVWRPDVALHCANDLDAAAQHVYRVTRAAAEADSKQTVSGGLCHGPSIPACELLGGALLLP